MNLKKQLFLMGKKPKDIVQEFDVTRQRVQNWLTGSARPTQEHFSHFARFMKIRECELYDFYENFKKGKK